MNTNYFFKPRYIKDKYEKGYKGYRTLVLGVFHVCLCDCEFRDDCFKNTKKYDKECPEYKDRDEYYALSNSNEIEVESYLEQVHSHYSYGYITKYFYKTNKSVSEELKREFWDSVAFTNFLQNMHMSYQTLEYKKNKKMFNNNIPAFMTLLNELQPEVIYVIDKAVKDCLYANNISGLEYVDCYEDWQVPVYRFTYKLNSKAEPQPQDILKEIEFKLTKENEKVVGNSYKIFLDKINAINDMTFSVKDRNIDKVDKVLYSYALDKKFVKYLEDNWQKKEIEVGLRVALKKVLELENDIELDIIELVNIIIEINKRFIYTHQYMRDGFIVELFIMLNKELDETNNMIEFNFIRAMGYECPSANVWKSRKKNYTQRRRNKEDYVDNDNNKQQFILPNGDIRKRILSPKNDITDKEITTTDYKKIYEHFQEILVKWKESVYKKISDVAV
jgi:hypothetical protein